MKMEDKGEIERMINKDTKNISNPGSGNVRKGEMVNAGKRC